MRFVNCNVLSAADTGNANGNQIDSNQLINASFHAVFGDATASGTVEIQASNDISPDYYQSNTFTVTNWVNIPNASASVSSGAAVLISLENIAYRWLRVVFTHSGGGSSTINVNLFAQGV